MPAGALASAVALALSSTLACAGDPPPPPAFEIRGDTVVLDLAALPEWTLVEELRLDGYAEDLVPFPGGGGVYVDSRGRMALLQDQDNLVRFYSAEGVELTRIGTEGEGPGEFRGLTSAGFRADTLWVFDFRLERISLLHPDVGLVRSIALGPVLSGLSGTRLSPFFVHALQSEDRIVGAGSGSGLPGQVLFRLQPGNPEAAVLVTVPPPAQESSLNFQLSPTLSSSTSIPFLPRPTYQVARSGDVVAVVIPGGENGMARTELRLHDADGAVVTTRWLAWTAQTVPTQARSEALAARERGMRERLGAGADAAVAELGRRTPDVFPAVDGVAAGADGGVWLRVPGPEDGLLWLALDETGIPQARLPVGLDVVVNSFDSGRVWTVEADSLDVESVVRYRIERGGE